MKTRAFLAVATLPVLILTGISQMRGAENSVYLSVVIKNQAFDDNLGAVFKNRHNPDQNHQINIHLPELMVYNPSGTLIYSGTNPAENADFLKHLPQAAIDRRKVDGLLQKDEIFNVVPEFAKVKNTVQADHHYLVFSMTQFPAHIVCAPQDNAVREIGKQSGTLKIDVFQVALDMK